MGKGAAHVLPGGGMRSLWVFGGLQTYKVPSQRTGGAYSLFEVVTQPGAGPPPHVQHREDESFYVLDGEYEFLSGRRILRVGYRSTSTYQRARSTPTERRRGQGQERGQGQDASEPDSRGIVRAFLRGGR